MNAPQTTEPSGLAAMAERWRAALPSSGRVDLTVDLGTAPELAALIDLGKPVTGVVSENSYIWWNGTSLCAGLGITWTIGKGTQLAAAGLEFDTAQRRAELASMHVASKFQGSGFGRVWLALVAGMCANLGLDKLDLFATHIGRYAWARMGFDFSSEEDRDVVLVEAEKFAARLNANVNIAHVRHPWELAALDGSTTSGEVAEIRGDQAPKNPHQAVRLGAALLLGPSGNDWNGTLDLASESSGRVRLDEYSGV